jgi:hypothetical protein
VLPELLDERVDWLYPISGKVKIPSRVIFRDHFPLRCEWIAKSEHAIPIIGMLSMNAEL